VRVIGDERPPLLAGPSDLRQVVPNQRAVEYMPRNAHVVTKRVKPVPAGAPIYFTSLELANVRAFGATQRLDLADQAGRPKQWTLIVGENGTGKTTILQCLGRMQPVRQWERDEHGRVKDDLRLNDKAPDHVEPDLFNFENEDFVSLLRDGEVTSQTAIKATLSVGSSLGGKRGGRGRSISIGAVFRGGGGKLKVAKSEQQHFTLPDPGPLFIGYGAARHVGHLNRSRVEAEHPSSSLFKDATDLYDAEEILRDLHHAALNSRQLGAGGAQPKGASGEASIQATVDEIRLQTILAAVADLLPEKSREDIRMLGPLVPGRTARDSGVQVRVSGNWTPLADLSIGYQTMFAWIVDLAWRLLERFPTSHDPMREAAVVLIDEIDLHLHPRWQRELRGRLTSHFPNVQFIATTHSPFMVLESLTADANVLLVGDEGARGSVISADAVPVGDWRVDQIATSRLFGLESARSSHVEGGLEQRRALIQKTELSKAEQEELERLDAMVMALPTASTIRDAALEEDIRTLAGRIEAGEGRR